MTTTANNTDLDKAAAAAAATEKAMALRQQHRQAEAALAEAHNAAVDAFEAERLDQLPATFGKAVRDAQARFAEAAAEGSAQVLPSWIELQKAVAIAAAEERRVLRWRYQRALEVYESHQDKIRRFNEERDHIVHERGRCGHESIAHWAERLATLNEKINTWATTTGTDLTREPDNDSRVLSQQYSIERPLLNMTAGEREKWDRRTFADAYEAIIRQVQDQVARDHSDQMKQTIDAL